MGSYCHHCLDHVHRHVAAVFAIGRNIGLRPSATVILANSIPHAALLRGPDTTRENVVDAPIVAIINWKRRSVLASGCSVRRKPANEFYPVETWILEGSYFLESTSDLACIDHKLLGRPPPSQKSAIDSGSGSGTKRFRRLVPLQILMRVLETVCLQPSPKIWLLNRRVSICLTAS